LLGPAAVFLVPKPRKPPPEPALPSRLLMKERIVVITKRILFSKTIISHGFHKSDIQSFADVPAMGEM